MNLTLEEGFELFPIVSYAANYAHPNDVIRRDLKPSKVSFDADGSPKGLNSSLAKMVGRLPPSRNEMNVESKTGR